MVADGGRYAFQTCKHLHALGFNKHVWVVLLQDLHARFFIDLPPGQRLSDFSASELVSLAKRAVHGPQSWSRLRLYPLLPTRQHILHSKRPSRRSLLFYADKEVTLLPGGHHVLFNNNNILECWNVAENRLIWTHENSSAEGIRCVLDFAAEVVDNHRAVNIIMCLHNGYAFPEQRQKCVRVCSSFKNEFF